MSDTPETEANRSFIEMETGYAWLCDCELTSNLERQRNDALQLARELRDALQLATDECLWRSDSQVPLSEAHSQKLYDVAIAALTKANQLLK